jgi:protein-tyrosine phosphatase
MAGGLLRMIARSKGMVVTVRTAGLAHHNGKRVAEHAITVMAELGIDISGEYSKPVTAQDLDWADMILPVQRDHGDHLIEDFPDVVAKIHFLDSDVPDPYLGPLTEYREKRDLLYDLLFRLVESLQA